MPVESPVLGNRFAPLFRAYRFAAQYCGITSFLFRHLIGRKKFQSSEIGSPVMPLFRISLWIEATKGLNAKLLVMA